MLLLRAAVVAQQERIARLALRPVYRVQQGRTALLVLVSAYLFVLLVLMYLVRLVSFVLLESTHRRLARQAALHAPLVIMGLPPD